MTDKYKDLLQKRADYIQAAKATGRDIITEAAQAVFDAHEEVTSITWRQFTPSFNDGDPCYFRVGESVISTDDEDDVYFDDSEAVDAFYDIQQDTDLMEWLFGDPVEVSIVRGADGSVELSTERCSSYY